MAVAKQPILGGFIIRPVRYAAGETVIREHAAFMRLGPTPLLLSGTLQLTSERLVWTSFSFVTQFPLADISTVSLSRQLMPGWLDVGITIGKLRMGRGWSIKVRAQKTLALFRLRPTASILPWSEVREKEATHRWVELVKHWADVA